MSGAYAGFLKGGGPNFKISGNLDIHAPPPPPKKIFKNGAISCVLRAILTTFMVKNPLKKF